MGAPVSWILDLKLHTGRENDFRALMTEMVDATKADEPGTLGYEWSLTDDGTRCHIHEQYADSDAVMVHLGNFGAKYAERFMAVLTPVGFTIYGSPSTAVKEALAGFSPTYFSPAAGFTR